MHKKIDDRMGGQSPRRHYTSLTPTISSPAVRAQGWAKRPTRGCLTLWGCEWSEDCVEIAEFLQVFLSVVRDEELDWDDVGLPLYLIAHDELVTTRDSKHWLEVLAFLATSEDLDSALTTISMDRSLDCSERFANLPLTRLVLEGNVRMMGVDPGRSHSFLDIIQAGVNVSDMLVILSLMASLDRKHL
tara:strand:- start:5403 stop:5966 length:564 start_codon:yes stop_codon:yes gene_type:complete